MIPEELETKALKQLALERDMSVEEIKKYRVYSSRSLNSEEWIEYLKLCEKAFKKTSKYLYLYEHEIGQINKYINKLQQENQELKEKIEELQLTIISLKNTIDKMQMPDDYFNQKEHYHI